MKWHRCKMVMGLWRIDQASLPDTIQVDLVTYHGRACRVCGRQEQPSIVWPGGESRVLVQRPPSIRARLGL